MVALTPLTILIQFIPAIVVTIGYTLLFARKRNRFIEAFIVLMYLQAVTFFILNLVLPGVLVTSIPDAHVEADGLFGVLFSGFLFSFTYAVQEFFTWIMVSFIAVLFGQLMLVIRLALQDPMKMKFKNIIQRIVGKEPETDGYSGLRDRLDNIHFEGVEQQPLDPEVVKKAWSESWKDYLIIGLATLLPSISFYMGDHTDLYVYSILVFLLWMYRFGYPASNRIAKAAGMKLGDREIGEEMMGGVLGWFFRLNLVLSIVTIAFTVFDSVAAGTLADLGMYYAIGLALAAPPILFVILIFPLAEDFSVVLYKRVFESIHQAKAKAREINPKGFLKNLASSGVASLMVIGAFVGAVFAVCLSFSWNNFMGIQLYPDDVDGAVIFMINFPINNYLLESPIVWTLMMLMIPIGMMLLLGVIAHYIRRYSDGGIEGFAFFSGLFVSTAVWLLIPGMDYILDARIIPVEFAGEIFHRVVPIIITPTAEQLLLRIAYQFVIGMPFFISVVLFILYYFEFRESWRKSLGEEFGPMLNVHARDIKDAVLLFVVGVVGSVIGVFILTNFIDIGFVMGAVVEEIGAPNGLELVLAHSVSYFVILVEHNVIRTLLMLIAGPVFWAIILWLVGVQAKETGDRKIGYVSFILVLLVGAASYIWTYLDMAAGIFVPALWWGDASWPWTFAAELGARAAVLYGILFAGYFLIIIVNHFGKGGIGGWWLPPLLTLFAIEYFVYDDQFTLIALVVLPMILALVYKVAYSGRPEVRDEDPLITFIRFSLMSLAIAEILSTALWVAGIGTLHYFGGTLDWYLAGILPHAIIEIPAFLFAAAASLRIARDLAPTIVAEEWAKVPSKTKELLTDARLWRTYLLVIFFLVVAALVESNVSEILRTMFPGP
ncbi:MAG: stage II sporulation protein M [Candidatus Thorarchaeota archaeon]